MAESWQRLISNRFRDVDILMLRHELLEMKYIEQGLSQSQAHDKTNETYNYGTEIEKLKGAIDRMVCIRNIKKKGSLISCDYYPENKSIAGNIVVDIKSKKIIEHTRVSEEEFYTYPNMARVKLLEFADKDEFPTEAFCCWY